MVTRCLFGLVLAALPATVSADPSLECSLVSSSQVETSACLAEVEKRVDETLGIALNSARASATELDEITGRTVALPALEASQAAWDAYRAAHCEYTGTLSGGGSGTGISIRSCRISLTRARVEELLSRL
ncbi:lysozyme inhibitor LprI family protein [Roseobacter ponti]|uniref:DUF1311 domain-containing protein n=1 Tax=Roseobacter ponti TaxID=1891787 RepID=A0A858SY68_9RHOB|nr:lysozyme inhibitor LprI family protein [Roseobacter ponti]QJF53007.1 DUF1311 domain-containing protein [Roseobacter ponti]